VLTVAFDPFFHAVKAYPVDGVAVTVMVVPSAKLVPVGDTVTVPFASLTTLRVKEGAPEEDEGELHAVSNRAPKTMKVNTLIFRIENFVLDSNMTSIISTV
jgi:hypothetical protein